MLEAGHCQRHVTGVFEVSQSTVAKMWGRFRTHGNVRYKHGSCRERVTTQPEDRFFVVQAENQAFLTATQNDLQNANGVRIFTKKIKSCLH